MSCEVPKGKVSFSGSALKRRNLKGKEEELIRSEWWETGIAGETLGNFFVSQGRTPVDM